MKLPRRKFLHLAAGAAALPAVPRFARAQAYPARPVRIIVHTSAGSATDIAARLIGQWLSERLGQQFIVENRAGAGGNVGTEMVRSAPDGYTLLMVNGANAISSSTDGGGARRQPRNLIRLVMAAPATGQWPRAASRANRPSEPAQFPSPFPAQSRFRS
jgi:tripartite-type tricarboxylate transporter receptor subunit TctC